MYIHSNNYNYVCLQATQLITGKEGCKDLGGGGGNVKFRQEVA